MFLVILEWPNQSPKSDKVSLEEAKDWDNEQELFKPERLKDLQIVKTSVNCSAFVKRVCSLKCHLRFFH